MVFSIGLASYETYQSYAHGENWQREAVIQGGKVLADVVVGSFLGNSSKQQIMKLLEISSKTFLSEELVGTSALILTPIGWIIAAVLTAFALYELNNFYEEMVISYWRN